MHGGLRVDFIVSAPKRDAENVPRLTERSPRKRHAMRGQVQDQPARRSACEAGQNGQPVVACRPDAVRGCC